MISDKLLEINDYDLLRATTLPEIVNSNKALTICDLFCGVGGMSLGIKMALSSINVRADFKLIVEHDLALANSFKENFGSEVTHITDIVELISDNDLTVQSDLETNWVDKVGKIDILLAGPPCQGHSDLNNHTRRNDPRNSLLKSVAKAIQIFEPKLFVIENVQGMRKDQTKSFDYTINALLHLGYNIATELYHAPEFGIPQNRRRCFVIGSKTTTKHRDTLPKLDFSNRTVAWAIKDLLDEIIEGDPFRSPSKHSSVNQARIDILHNEGLYELPNEHRPSCHRDKTHAYNSVYSRMRWDGIAPTITCGFGSIGQGRFGHPERRTGITPHEAARLQSFPDFFKFSGLNRGKLQKAIGNAVPPLMFSKIIKPVVSDENW